MLIFQKMTLLISLFYGTVWLLFAQEDTLEQSMKRGEELYATNCASCHQPEGGGVEDVFPPLANTAYLKDQRRAINILLKGQEGEITVNGKKYNTPMPAVMLSDKEVSDVLNFISNNWGNKYPRIMPAQVKAERK